MIEGLRLLPSFQEADRRRTLGFPSSCDACRKQLGVEQRQILACGWEPAPPINLRPFVKAWANCGVESRPATDDAPAFPSVCAGFTTSLPEVIEVARARTHWKSGELGQFVRGQASDEMLLGIEILEGAINTVQMWSVENPIKKGG